MFRILPEGTKSPREIQKAAFELACALEGVNPLTKEAKERIDIRHSVGRLMLKKTRGRAYPVHKSKGPRIDDRRRYYPLGNLFQGAYPRKVQTTQQKKRYLNQSLESKNITKEIYTELVSVLD